MFYIRGPPPLGMDRSWSGPVRNQDTWQEVSLDVMHLNYPETVPPPPWKNCLPRNQSLVPKRLGTAVLHDYFYFHNLHKMMKDFERTDIAFAI